MLLIEGLDQKPITPELKQAFSVVADVAISEHMSPFFFHDLSKRSSTKVAYGSLIDQYMLILDKHSLTDIIERVEKVNPKITFFIKDVDDKARIARELLQWDLQTFMPTIDEYVDAKPIQKVQDVTSNLKTDSEGLVFLDSTFDLQEQGIIYKDKLLYYHQFLRRFFTANFVDTTVGISQALKDGVKVRVHLDPMRISEPHRLLRIKEADYWYGDKFSIAKLNDPKFVGWTVHERGVEAKRMLELTYPIKRTVFYVKNYDDGTKEIQIEEILPEHPRVGAGEKYVLHRFAHLIWNKENEAFSHMDCSVLAYKKADQLVRASYDWKPPRNVDVKGKRMKLFRLDGDINFTFALQLLNSYFRYNEMVEEYFSSTNFRDSQMYLESHFAQMDDRELAKLDAIIESHQKGDI